MKEETKEKIKEKIKVGTLYFISSSVWTLLFFGALSYSDIATERKLIMESFILGGGSLFCAFLVFSRLAKILNIDSSKWKLL